MYGYVTQTLRRPVLAETVILILICFLDTAHTLTVVRMGIAREVNPMIAWTLAHSDFMFVGFKVGVTAGILFTLEHIRRYCDPFVRRAMRMGIYGYVGVYVIGSILVALPRG